MSKKEFLLLLFSTILIIGVFFKNTLLYHQIPFPGDLLVDTTPFKSESFAGFAPGGYPNKAQGRDVITQLIPWRMFSVDQIKKGQLPLWNPYNFSGNVHIANYQSGVFYPLTFIFYIFPFSFAWTLFILLQPVLALLFMYIFLKSLKISSIPALLGGVAFAFSSYMTVWMEYGNIGHTLLWLPLMLFAIKKYVHQKTLSSGVIFVIAGICCLLAGYIQGAFYVFSISVLYGISLGIINKDKKIWMSMPLLFVIPVGISAIQIFPTIAIFLSSTRGIYTSSQIHNLLNPWYYWTTLFASEFFGNPATRNFYLPITYFERVMYVGIPILFFAIYALQKVRNFEIKFFASIALFVLLITTNIPGVSWIYALPIPVVSTTVPTRLLSIFIFCMTILGVLGIDYWIRKKDTKSIAPFLIGGIYILIWIGLFVAGKVYPQWLPNIVISKHTLILSTSIAFATICIFYLRIKTTRVSVIFLICLVIFDLWYIFTKFTPFAPVTFFYPPIHVVSYLHQYQGIYRNWGYGDGYIPANYATVLGIYQPDGYDSLHYKEYNRLLNSSSIGKNVLPLSRTDANIAPGSGFARLPDNTYRQTVLNLLGVKYIVHVPFSGEVSKAETGVLPEDHFKFVWHDDSYQIYENLNAFPRFFLTNDFKIVTENNDIQNIYTTDLRKTILLYEKPYIALGKGQSVHVKLVSYQPNEVKLESNTDSNQLLFFSDTYDPGWHAMVDGTSTKVYKADVAFRAIVVPAGKHNIVFSYQPESFKIGLMMSLVTIGLGGFYLLLRRLINKN